MMNSKEFVMILLDCFNGRIESATRVQKLAFLTIQESNVSSFANFRWRNFGPFSGELKRSLDEMNRNGLIRIEKEERITFMGDPYTITIFQLTEDGQERVERLKEQVDETILSAIHEIIDQYGYQPLNKLLNYVYTAYSPDDL